jgi:succinate dehydrogenase/fumarate reductase flavoprotein subunit
MNVVDQVVDVIVVGGGGSGLAAAVSAASFGLQVLLLEKQAELGGSTGIAVGSLTANRTRIQEKAGIIDTLDAHALDAGLFAPPQIEDRNNAELRRWFLSHSAETLHWLMDMGLQFYGPNPEPPNRLPRMHNVVPGAKAYIATLQIRLQRLGGKVLTNAPVVDLISEDGRVTGVAVQVESKMERFFARCGVVLAAGDYANSPVIIARFKGSQYSDIEGINPRSTGDGHLLAEAAGARMINMDITYGPELRFIPPAGRTFQQLLPVRGPLVQLMGRVIPYLPNFVMSTMIRRLLVTWQHPENALFNDGAILINQQGQRFCDELQTPEREIAIAQQPGKLAYILLDQGLIQKYNQWPHFISTAPKIGYAYVEDYLKLRPDVAVRASTLQGLAEKRRLPLINLERSVREYNHQAQVNGQRGMENGAWVLLGPTKSYFTTTEGGAAINQRFEVLDMDNSPIPGLYAIGQNGLGGQILWGHGLHIAWAITSGRLVGEYLASLRAAEKT